MPTKRQKKKRVPGNDQALDQHCTRVCANVLSLFDHCEGGRCWSHTHPGAIRHGIATSKRPQKQRAAINCCCCRCCCCSHIITGNFVSSHLSLNAGFGVVEKDGRVLRNHSAQCLQRNGGIHNVLVCASLLDEQEGRIEPSFTR